MADPNFFRVTLYRKNGRWRAEAFGQTRAEAFDALRPLAPMKDGDECRVEIWNKDTNAYERL